MGIVIAPLLFLLLPLAEIATFVLVGREVGVGMTLLLVLAGMIAGVVLLRLQGLGTLRRLQQTTAKGGDPGRELVHGVMIVIAGILLIVPGFLSDIVGLLLFLPPVRDFAWRLIRDRLTIVTASSGATAASGFGFSAENAPPQSQGRGPHVIDLDDGEFSRDRPEDRDRLR